MAPAKRRQATRRRFRWPFSRGGNRADVPYEAVEGGSPRRSDGAAGGTSLNRLLQLESPKAAAAAAQAEAKAAGGGGGGAPVARAEGGARHVLPLVMRTNLKRFVVVFEAVRAQSKALAVDARLLGAVKATLGFGGGRAAREELFYQRRILMGRRCQVQHLEESPYD